MDDSRPTRATTLSMRRRRTTLSDNGWKMSNIAFSPRSLVVLEEIMDTLDLTSREAVVNAVFERLAGHANLKQELLAVTP